ncbi:hypothetical protein [Actinoplanes xinjiangensis]|uniref:hypothetical protein n=1 Tax=Actinoplanes xinjiangensis TaxID=512350 RepID=UPI00341BE303
MQTSDREFTVEIARAIVGETDPDQLPYVDADAEAYFADPRGALKARPQGTPLGSGVEVAVGLTAVALYVAQAALDVVLEESIKKGISGVREFLKSRRKPTNDLVAGPGVPTFSDEQIHRVTDAVAGLARGRGLDTAAATALADAVRERLPREPGPSTGS